MKCGLICLLTFLLAACAATPPSEPRQPPVEPSPSSGATAFAYPDLGAAPELAGDVWLNTDAPLRLSGLQGKVVLIDMWTFG